MTEITQADREAALRLEDIDEGSQLYADAMSGKHDDWVMIQAFARHRMEERAAIVAWLRGMGLRNMNYIADSIEAGDHLK